MPQKYIANKRFLFFCRDLSLFTIFNYVLQSQIVILEFGYSKEGAIFAFPTTTNIITSPTRVSRLRCSDDRYSSMSGNVRCYTTVFASENVKFDDLASAKRLDGFFGIVFDDGRLVNEYISLGVVSFDESVAVLDIKPLDGSRDFEGDEILRIFTHFWQPVTESKKLY